MVEMGAPSEQHLKIKEELRLVEHTLFHQLSLDDVFISGLKVHDNQRPLPTQPWLLLHFGEELVLHRGDFFNNVVKALAIGFFAAYSVGL